MFKNSKYSFLSLDLRSLAFFRILISTILIVDLICRFQVIDLFYVDSGLIPRFFLLDNHLNKYFFSVLNAFGEKIFVELFFFCTGFFYLCLLVGYRTRLFNFLAWICFVSFSARAPIITHGGDDLLRLGLFWLMFLPSNLFLSIDSAFNKNRTTETTSVLSISSFALMIQLIAMYFFTGILKWHPIWTKEASAIFFALQLDQFITPIGRLIRSVPFSLTQLLTQLTLFIELVFTFLVFFPLKNSSFRWVAIFTFLSFHFGLFLSLYLGVFPWICMAYWVVFIPTSFWESIQNRLKLAQEKITIYYDAECGYCLKMLNFLQVFLMLDAIKIEKSQETEEIYKILKKENSWVIKDQNSDQKFFLRYDAFLILLKSSYLSFLSKPMGLRFLRKFFNSVYKLQAKYRSRLGQFLNSLKVSQNHFKNNSISEFLCLISLVIAMSWNISEMRDDDQWILPESFHQLGSIFRLHQKWDMFAPFPWKNDGWYVVDAQLLNGKNWDIFNNQAVNFEKPTDFNLQFNNTYIRKYLINIYNKNNEDYRLYFGRYLCRVWNSNHEEDEKVDEFKINYMLDQTRTPFEAQTGIEKVLIWQHHCFDKPK